MAVDEHYQIGKGNISFFEAPLQADPCLAKMIVDKNADMIILDISDFSMDASR
jgi:hypothetical protein